MSYPGIYSDLITYSITRQIEILAVGLYFTFGLIATLITVENLKREYIQDFIIIGSPYLGSYFQDLLTSVGRRSKVILSRRSTSTLYQVEGHPLGYTSKSVGPKILFPHPTSDQFQKMSEILDISLSNLNQGWEDLRKRIISPIVEPSLLDLKSSLLPIYQLDVISSNHNTYRDEITFLEKKSEVFRLILKDGTELYSRYVINLDSLQGMSIEDYYDLDTPLGSKVESTYNFVPDNISTPSGAYLEDQGKSLLFYQDTKVGIIQVSTVVPTMFHPTTGKYQIQLDQELHTLFPKIKLPSITPTISQIYFPVQDRYRFYPGAWCLDNITLNSDRDILILLHTIIAMIRKDYGDQ